MFLTSLPVLISNVLNISTCFFCVVSFIQNDNKPLSEKRELCNLLKYVAALLVVNGHIFLFGLHDNPWTKDMNLGAQCVSIFLFFSGYGLMNSYQKKGDDYLKGFLTKRLGRILIPLVTAYALYIPIYYLTKGPIDITNVLTSLYSPDPFLKFSWYVSEIIILYLLFYFCYKLPLTTRYKAILLSVSTLFMMVVFFMMPDRGAYWIYSTPCFLMGLWYQQYEDKHNESLKKTSTVITLTLILFLTLALFRFDLTEQIIPPLHRWRYEYATYFIVNPIMLLPIIFILRNCKQNGLVHRTGLGNIKILNSFYEVYLCQAAVFVIVNQITDNDLSYYILSITGSIIVGYLMYLLNRRITNMIFCRS